jgi:fructose/tagatose bisphosphate aldolase
MALVDTKNMFAMAVKGGYAVGTFNVNNVELTQYSHNPQIALLMVHSDYDQPVNIKAKRKEGRVMKYILN